MDIPGNIDFEGLRQDPGMGLRLAGAIGRRHGLSHDCSTVTVRSQLVYAAGDRHIIKVFAPQDADFHRTETVFLTHLHGRLPIPTPELVASGDWQGLPYIVMERLQGVPLDTISEGLTPSEQRRIMQQVGEAIRALHALPTEPFAAAPFQWAPLIDHQRDALLDNHQSYGLDQAWVDQLRDYVEACPPEDRSPDSLVPLHTELMGEHILVREDRGRWTVCGLIDFEPSMIGQVEYEFCAVGLFLSRGDRDLFRLFLSSYGYDEPAFSAELSKRIMTYLLLHRYSNLKWFFTFLPPGARFTRLQELEQFWYGL